MSGTITRTVAATLAALALCAASASFAGTTPLNINTASAAELASLKGIGPAKAQAIVEHRDKNGQFFIRPPLRARLNYQMCLRRRAVMSRVVRREAAVAGKPGASWLLLG